MADMVHSINSLTETCFCKVVLTQLITILWKWSPNWITTNIRTYYYSKFSNLFTNWFWPPKVIRIPDLCFLVKWWKCTQDKYIHYQKRDISLELPGRELCKYYSEFSSIVFNIQFGGGILCNCNMKWWEIFESRF